MKLILLIACMILVISISPTIASSSTSKSCNVNERPWGGQCWSKKEGAAFVTWLKQHGSSPPQLKKNYPQMAAWFNQPWPPVQKAYWQTCHEGYACAVAVLPHYFEDWHYALRIVSCETGGTYDAEALGAAGEIGWFQIHPVHFGWADPSRLDDVRYNASVAFRLSEHGRDWSPWTCARYV